MSARVTSEVGRLRKVIVHQPGPEVAAVTPQTREQFLYDDIIALDRAAEEHRRFASILARFAQVYELADLLRETLAIPEAQEFLIQRSEEVTADKRLGSGLADDSAETLVQRFIEGWQGGSGPFSEALESHGYRLPPLPNLFFTRDAASVVGGQVVISKMRFPSRWPEAALLRTIFGFHPELAGTPVLYDGSDERRHDYTVEGGDVHPLRDDLVLIGISERTSVAAVDVLSDLLFENSGVRDVLAVVLPERSTAIHLDMVWTQLDRELCAVYPPMFRGPRRAPVLHRTRGQAGIREPGSLFDALKDLGMPMTPVFTGGDLRAQQDREQWSSGCNFFAVAPGQVVAYSRNDHTLRALEQSGFAVVDGEALLLGDAKVGPDDRAVITFSGGELVRGGGGARCMTCPVLRDPLD